MISITIPRHILISANDRMHWAAKARRTKELRSRAFWIARAQHLQPMERAHLVVTIHWTNRSRRRDVSNLAPTIKALVDGFVQDAGLLPDDDDLHLIGPDLRVAPDTTAVLTLDFAFYRFYGADVQEGS
jgi:crossover junction endodeoxyribonuclease RusA